MLQRAADGQAVQMVSLAASRVVIAALVLGGLGCPLAAPKQMSANTFLGVPGFTIISVAPLATRLALARMLG